MSVTQSASHEASARGARRAWEPPALSELALRTEAKSKRETTRTTDRGMDAAPPPAQSSDPPLAKLGFAIESSFPLSARTDK